MAFTISEMVGNSSSSGLYPTCESLLIASSLIDDGRLRTPSKCSAHLFKMASLSVRRLVSSALRNGVALGTMYCLKFIKELLRILSVCKGLDYISLLLSKESCLTLGCFVVYFTRRIVLCLTLCYFVLVFFSPFSIAITSLGEETANLSVFVPLVALRLFGFVCFLFLLWSGKGCGL